MVDRHWADRLGGKTVFKIGDKVVVIATGERGVVTEALGLGCYMVRLEGWPEDCQVHEHMLARNED